MTKSALNPIETWDHVTVAAGFVTQLNFNGLFKDASLTDFDVFFRYYGSNLLEIDLCTNPGLVGNYFLQRC